jgi:hypothetical protein
MYYTFGNELMFVFEFPVQVENKIASRRLAELTSSMAFHDRSNSACKRDVGRSLFSIMWHHGRESV